MKALSFAAILSALTVCVAPAFAQDTAFAALRNADGEDVGSVSLTQVPTGVLLKLDLTGISAGTHALHFHETGKCEPPDFKSAGGHFNPEGKKHGLLNPDGPHAGDMPNLHVPGGGVLTIEVLNTNVTLEKGAKNSLRDGDGTAVVIHAAADDYTSDPAGHAGDRLACGVVE